MLCFKACAKVQIKMRIINKYSLKKQQTFILINSELFQWDTA